MKKRVALELSEKAKRDLKIISAWKEKPMNEVIEIMIAEEMKKLEETIK